LQTLYSYVMCVDTIIHTLSRPPLPPPPKYRHTTSAQWGGAQDSYFTGHMTNGKRVSRDARDVTRHVIGGLAQSIAGVSVVGVGLV